MDGKQGHVTCGNRLAIERQESFQKFASLEEELLLPSAQACWDPTNLVPRVVSEPLFQSSSQKTTLAQAMELSNLIG